MSINASVNKIASSPRTWSQLGNGVKALSQKCFNEYWQNPPRLKENAFIASTFILILSRMVESGYAAGKMRDTKDGPYRYREFVRTVMREGMGWTMSYMVLRAFITLLQVALRKKLNLQVKVKSPIVQFAKNIKNYLSKNGRGDVQKLIDHINQNGSDYWGKERLEFKNPEKTYEELTRTKFGQKLIDLFSCFKTGLTKEQKLASFYQWFPISVSVAPTVALSGFWLEYFNREHSDKVVEAISKWKNKNSIDSPPIQEDNLPALFPQSPFSSQENQNIAPIEAPIETIQLAMPPENIVQVSHFLQRQSQPQPFSPPFSHNVNGHNVGNTGQFFHNHTSPLAPSMPAFSLDKNSMFISDGQYNNSQYQLR